ncbi:hypothetical protein OG429_17150 [Streptomyces sp. NBC_00190]|uniref:D-alanyl-D-alanine carboxypeptidase n=1 Tax=unclassified Streptomyces TaxID=2593676 RepID=UPI002E2A3A9B|nr:hypothetical protein [Streptomyces sp. NBC_00190]WSZ45031.1 hypothetical protein OG239_19850 [Streptomyces sp. NBC_00868]
MEEELVAGESPDKSVDEGTPGAASTSAEGDPRLSVFRPRDPEAPAAERDALRDVVAAWVATSEEKASEEDRAPERGSGAASSSPDPDSAGSSVRAESASASDGDGEADGEAETADSGSAPKPADSASGPAEPKPAPADRPADSAPAEPKAAPAAEKPAAVEQPADSDSAAPKETPARKAAPAARPADSASAEQKPAVTDGSADGERTAVFRAAKPAAAKRPADSGSAEPKAAPADESAGSERTAVFRVAKSAAADSAPAGSKETPGDRSGDAGSAAPKSAPAEEPAGSERTAVFRVAKSAAADSAPAGSKETPGNGSGDAGSAAPKSAPAEEPADSARTAVFRAVKPKADSASASASASDSASEGESVKEPAPRERTGVFRIPKVDSDADSADSERTAVFRAVKPKPAADSGPAEPTAAPADESADSERTAVFRAVKPAAADSAAAAPKASTFVPLRTDEPGQQPKPKPAETPAPKTPAAKTPAPKTPAQGAPAAKAPAPEAPAAKAPAPKAPAPKAPAPKVPAPASGPASGSPSAPAMDRAERTTQQPLPPRPPLDMLADLTNNPPPPPSPLRTAIRRFKIYFPLVVLLAIILAVVQLVRPLPQPKLVMTAKSQYTFGGSKPDLPWPSEGQAYMAAAGLGTLGQSGEQKPVPIASVTKSMTAYIILRDHPIKKGEQGALIDIDKTAETEGKKNNSTDNESTLDTVKEGEKISEYDAIAALMIPSANNIARLLARWDSGSQEAFVKKMNDTAKELGMKNTTYTDPSGLDATTVSTAEDQVKLGLKLVEIETLLEITKKPNWTDPSGKSWRNWNGLVPANDSLGIKTGTTTKAGGNLLFAAQKKVGKTNQLIVGAVLGQHKPPIIDSVVAASRQLMIATQKSLDGAPVVKKGEVVGYVDDGLGGRTPVVATADVQAVGWAGLTVDVKLADGGSKIPQTATAGTEIGVLTVGEGASQVKVPVALQSDLAAPGIGSKLTRVG